MVMTIYFANQVELYNRLLPVLRIKKKEFKKNITNIEEKDIWEYLKKNKWNHATGLSLSIMVDDILSLNLDGILTHVAMNKQEVI